MHIYRSGLPPKTLLPITTTRPKFTETVTQASQTALKVPAACCVSIESALASWLCHPCRLNAVHSLRAEIRVLQPLSLPAADTATIRTEVFLIAVCAAVYYLGSPPDRP